MMINSHARILGLVRHEALPIIYPLESIMDNEKKVPSRVGRKRFAHRGIAGMIQVDRRIKDLGVFRRLWLVLLCEEAMNDKQSSTT